MPKPLAIQIKFMFDRSNLSSQRDYELQNSEARSHIAKIVHTRKQKTSPPQRKARPLPSRQHSSDTETESSELRTGTTVAPSTNALPLLTTHYLDPLFNVPHPKERSFYKAMDIWFQWILPSAAPAFIIFNVGNMFASVSRIIALVAEYREWDISDFSTAKYFSSPGCQSEAAQHCIAALAYGCLEQHRQETMSWEYDYRQEQMRHNGAALALLKKDITSEKFTANSPTTINTIFLLSFLAQFRGDSNESALHRRTLKGLLGSLQGPIRRTDFDSRYGELLLQFSCWMDLLEGQPNVLQIMPDDDLQYELISPFDRSLVGNGYDVEAHLPGGFEKLVTRGSISRDTQRLLARFSHACQYGLQAVPLGDNNFPDFAMASPHVTSRESTLEKCLVLALICYAHMRWAIAPNYVAGILCHTISRTKLAQALAQAPNPDDQVEINCLVWIWCILIDSYRLQGSVLPKLGMSSLGEFKWHFPEWQSWERIEEEILPQFFWRDEDSVAIKNAWNHGMDERALSGNVCFG